MAGLIKMPLGTKVHVDPGDIMLDADTCNLCVTSERSTLKFCAAFGCLPAAVDSRRAAADDSGRGVWVNDASAYRRSL